MKKKLARKIGYVVATLICVAAILFVVASFKALKDSRLELAQAHLVFDQTNRLVSSLNAAKAHSRNYVMSRNDEALQRYHHEIYRSLQMMDTLFAELPEECQNQMFDIIQLFDQKEDLLKQLSQRNLNSELETIFAQTPELPISVGEPSPRVKSEIQIDTILIEDERGFLRKLFSKKRAPKQIITIRQHDSILREQILEHSSLSSESAVDTLFREIQQRQKNQLLALEKQYEALLSTDQHLDDEISSVIIRLHETALNLLIDLMKEKDEAARNTLLTGIAAFLIIFGAIFLIFRNNRKTIRYSREIAESKRISEELMNSRHELLLSISHDIKAPLVSVLSYLEFWNKGKLSREKIRQFSSMQNSATHILDTLTNLLEFSRLEQRKTQLHNETFEPIPFFSELIDLFKPASNARNIEFSYSFELLENCRITMDSRKLRTIVSNLITNSIRDISQGKIQLFVTFLDTKNCLNIRIIERRSERSDQNLDAILKPFFHSENHVKAADSNSFILYVVRGLIDVMNGTISVETTENTRVFDIQLPNQNEKK